MSMSIDLELEDSIDIETAFEILNSSVTWQQIGREPNRIYGAIPGSRVSVLKPSDRLRALSVEVADICPELWVSFNVDKFAAYETAYMSVLTSIAALLRATSMNAVATIGEGVFLRRMDGRTTLYNDTGLFNADVQPQWRPMFSFADDFKERFER